MSGAKEQSITFRGDPDYDPDPFGLRSESRGGDLHSLTDYPGIHVIPFFVCSIPIHTNCSELYLLIYLSILIEFPVIF